MLQTMIIGNVGQDAVQQEKNGSKFITFSVAVNDSYKNADGVKVEKTTWVSVLSQQLAVGQYIKAGTKIYVQGKLEVKMYRDKDNQHAVAINLRANLIELLSSAKKPDTVSAGVSAGEDDTPF